MRSIKKQTGVSLIELMIVGVLMLAIGLSMVKIMMTANKTSAHTNGVSQAQETARLTTTLLYQQIRKAGFSADLQAERIQPFSNICTDNTIIPPDDNAHCSFNSEDTNDRIAIRRTFNDDSAYPWEAEDCTGIDLKGTAGLTSGESVLVDVYWVESAIIANGNSHEKSEDQSDSYDDVLKCVTYNDDTGKILNFPQTLASGIEGLQALYAESDVTPGKTGIYFGDIYNYRSLDTSIDMNSVYAVRIAVLTRAFSNFNMVKANRSYILFDAKPYSFTNDQIPRQIQITTVALKNYTHKP